MSAVYPIVILFKYTWFLDLIFALATVNSLSIIIYAILTCWLEENGILGRHLKTIQKQKLKY